MIKDGKVIPIYYDWDGNLITPDVLRYDREGDRILSDEEQWWGLFDANVIDAPPEERRSWFKTQKQYETWCRINGQPIVTKDTDADAKPAD